MFAKMQRVRPAAWLLIALVTLMSVGSLLAVTLQVAPSNTILYIVQPLCGLLVAYTAYRLANGKHTTVHHANDKAIIIASVLAIWFVVYFASGVFFTYIHNALFSTIQGLLFNLIGFGLSAAALEYTRLQTLVLAGRRNAAWFGVLVTIIFAISQMNLIHLSTTHTAEDAVKLIISDFTPALINSLLLTYLAFSTGLKGMLTYRLGLVAMTILPPIIPKYDWYLIGVTSILLTIVVYLVVDRLVTTGREPRTRHHLNKALEASWICAIIALILFMTGFFAYKPNAIMSNSMVPVFSRGSMVIVQKNINKMDIKVGDIIQYEAHGLIITHRVVQIDQATDGSGERVFITKGDNNPSRDEPVAISHVIGAVRAAIPYIGYPTVWLRELTVGNQSDKVNK